MAKNCLIYETLNGVKEMNVNKTSDGLMTLSGVFGVCGVRNNNQRVYETANYSKMITEMQSRIKEQGGIPGELEHPQMMNITLENVSHKITSIDIDENGLVTGSITLLNTPKGKIAQAIVEGGLPLFISSRATGQVDSKTGNVTLERIATYDLVGSPGFSQAKLHLNENQVAEAINESQVYYITEKENENENKLNENNKDNMELTEILEKIENLETRIADLEEENADLQEQLNEVNNIDVEKLANGIQNWIIEEYSPVLQNWVMEEFAPEMEEKINENVDNETIVENVKDMFINEMAPKIQNWIVNEFAPEIQNWIVESYSPEIESWCINEFAPGIQNWIVEEFAPEAENWLNESYLTKVNNLIDKTIVESKKNNMDSIEKTLTLLESMDATKPTYSRKTIITENADEPLYIQNMPADVRVKWDMASQEIKESIQRRAKIYNFTTEGAIDRFWNSIDFENIKPANKIYEGLDKIEDERERNLRMQLRSWRNRR